MDYPHRSINMNGREIGIREILSHETEARSAFENSTFKFVREWFSDVDNFEMRTSGSTGDPKVISIRRSQMIANASSTITALGLTKNDTALVCLDTEFIAGKMMMVRGFLAGMALIAVDPTSNPFSRTNDSAISFTALVPLQLEEVLKSVEKNRLNSLRYVLIGGAAVSEEIIHSISSMNCHVIATYGMTETVSHVALRRLNGMARQDAFETLPGVTVETDPRGCLIINAFYLDRPLVTNDLCEVLSPTAFKWLGRSDNVINTGGVKVSPEAVEQMLERLKPELILHGRFIVSAVKDPRLGERVVLVIEGSPPEIERSRRQLKLLKGRLPKFHAPTEILNLDAFPETKTGKINRTAIKILVNSRV